MRSPGRGDPLTGHPCLSRAPTAPRGARGPPHAGRRLRRAPLWRVLGSGGRVGDAARHRAGGRCLRTSAEVDGRNVMAVAALPFNPCSTSRCHVYSLYSTLPCSTLIYATLLYSTLLYSTLLYSTLLYSTLLYSTLLYSTLLYSTLV